MMDKVSTKAALAGALLLLVVLLVGWRLYSNAQESAQARQLEKSVPLEGAPGAYMYRQMKGR
jgi:predicted negative regulator of RcsB-dependent stress response